MSNKIAVLTGGGDCPGLNAVIRAMVKTVQAQGWSVIGIRDGFSGLVQEKYVELDPPSISGLLHRGGTILGTNNRDNPFRYPIRRMDGSIEYKDLSPMVLQLIENLQVKALVVIGGDGSLAIARELNDLGAPIIGVPKTIDNDLEATDQTFGFDTAVATATDALDKLHTTAESHHRVMVLELMGRYAGWIALQSGIAGGADVILLPEIPWNLEAVVAKIMQRRVSGKPFSIVVVAEGARTPEGGLVVKQQVNGSTDPVRLGGIGQVVASAIEKVTGIESRCTVLGHLQRGGSPSPFDRVLATRLGVAAGHLAMTGPYGRMVCLRQNQIGHVSLAEATHRLRTVPLDSQLIAAARDIGISFGDC